MARAGALSKPWVTSLDRRGGYDAGPVGGDASLMICSCVSGLVETRIGGDGLTGDTNRSNSRVSAVDSG